MQHNDTLTTEKHSDILQSRKRKFSALSAEEKPSTPNDRIQGIHNNSQTIVSMFFEKKQHVLRQETKPEMCDRYYYHGIGADVTKLTLIGRYGLLTANQAAEQIPQFFAQSHGVTATTSKGGTNGRHAISVACFATDAYHSYCKNGISIRIAVASIPRERANHFPRTSLKGEHHIQGSIETGKLSGVCLGKELLRAPISHGIGESVLVGSSYASIKCQAFIKRVQMLYEFENEEMACKIIALARELDELNNFSLDRVSARNIQSSLTHELDTFFGMAIQLKYPHIKTYQAYLQNSDLNPLPPIIYKDSVYHPLIQTSDSLDQLNINIRNAF